MSLTEENKKLPSLKEFIFPPEEILRYIEDLSRFYQFSNQESVDVYEKWKDKENYSGTLGEYSRLRNMKFFFEKTSGKDWNPLINAIFLINNYSDDVSVKSLFKLEPIEQQQVIDLITKGQTAYEKITSWLSPINKGEILDAVLDAVKVTIGNERHVQFQVLKFADLKSTQNPDEGIGVYPFILEIDNPNALIEYFRMQKIPVFDCLILGFMRNKNYEFKPTIYMFLIWKNEFFVLDMGERRFNLESTAGARNPEKYIERNFQNVWLPLDIIIEGKTNTDSADILVRDQKIFRRANIFKIFEESPEMKAWIDMFIYRVLDYIKNQKNKIEQGFVPTDIVKMLEDKSVIEERIPIKSLEKYHTSFESSGDSSSYLIKKYGTKITSVVPTESSFPIIIGTKDRIEGIVKYKQREKLAQSLERELFKDWKKNHSQVYKRFNKFVMSHNVNGIISVALEDRKYPYMEVKGGSIYVNHERIEIKEPTMVEDSIIKIRDDYRWQDTDDDLTIIWNNHSLRNGHCEICNKFQWKKLIYLQFKDYRQICSFFNVDEDKLPVQFIEHFHRQNETEYGNPILSDTDPMDQINDFWFRDVSTKLVEGWENTKNMFASGEPYIKIIIPLCRRCLKKSLPNDSKLVIDNE